MTRIFPFIFVLLWSSAFITTKPIIDNSDPFAALAFRFFFVAIGFYLFSVYSKNSIFINKKNLLESIISGVLFHGLYLGGVFYSISIGMPTGIAALIVTLLSVVARASMGSTSDVVAEQVRVVFVEIEVDGVMVNPLMIGAVLDMTIEASVYVPEPYESAGVTRSVHVCDFVVRDAGRVDPVCCTVFDSSHS